VSIWLARIVRNALLAVYYFVLRYRSYSQVRAAMEGRRKVNVDFLGVFDTVEDFGVPIEELRTAIDWAIWPISFRNRVLAQRVLRARHALALDDERTTFQPIRFDHEMNDPRIEEVWRACTRTLVAAIRWYAPLCRWWGWPSRWSNDLRFQPARSDHFRDYQSRLGRCTIQRVARDHLPLWSPQI
jgi:hypothetical protein